MHSSVLLVLLLLPIGFAGSAEAAMPRLWLEPLPGAAQADLGKEGAAAYRLSPLGDAVAGLIWKRVAVLRAALATGQVTEFALDRLPQMRAHEFSVLADIDVDAAGSIYVPVVWRETGKVRQAGVGVWNSQGKYSRTITLDPPVEIRHLAVAQDGNLFVLGMDPDYFDGRRAEHMLVHKYSPDGKRLASFSRTFLPGPWAPAAGGTSRRELTTEADRGKLWIQDGLLWHMLPVTRALRVFTPEGSLVREVVFQPPVESGNGTATIWNVAAPGGDRFLVDWLFENLTRGLVMHNLDGRPSSALAGPRDGIGMPLACDSDGTCVVVRLAAGTRQVLTRARVTVR